MQAGLRLDQGPPFIVPLLFFLTAPLFLAAAGLYASMSWAEWTASRWTTSTLALTHLITLGYLAMVMLGALTQLAPVAAGAPLAKVISASRVSYGMLLLGLPPLVWGLAKGNSAVLLIGSLTSSLGLLILMISGITGLLKAPQGPTRQSMVLALFSLFGLMLLGLALTLWLAGFWSPNSITPLINSHVVLGLVGWISLLVIGSAYQVVPMLQVTPNYPPRLMRHLARSLAMLLTTWLVTSMAGWTIAAQISYVGLAVALALFALTTLDLQRRRRRKVGDSTLQYWRIGMISLLLSCVVTVVFPYFPETEQESLQLLLGLLFLLGFAASVVNGMLMKIVPFLAWFHLQAQVGMRQTRLSNMKDFFPDRIAKYQVHLHLAALALLLPSPWLPMLAIPGGLLLASSALLLETQLIRAYLLFRSQLGSSKGLQV